MRPATARIRRAALAAAVATATLSVPAMASAEPCEALRDLILPQAVVTSAVTVEAGPFPIQDASGARYTPMLPTRCVVDGTTRPTRDSEIRFQIWLPTTGWNGKYLQTGNGGWGGSVRPGALADGIQRGYAVAGTDNGHQGASFGSAQTWLIGHPEKLSDFAERAVHLTRVHAATIVQAFYGRAASRAYFAGCSEGGREAFVEAQRFADDFDGIMAGAPAIDWSRLMTGFVWNQRALLDSPASAVPPEKLPALQNAALAACDAGDGVADGRIEDPTRCQFDPAVLACRDSDSAQCLTAPQLEAVRKIYAGPRNPRTGEPLFPGFAPGAEAAPGNWPAWITAAVPANALQFGQGNAHFGAAVFEDPDWDYRTLDFDRDVAVSDRKVGTIVDATSPDLRSFRARGGKLIHYHGWGDAAIPAQSSVAYYEATRSCLAGFPDARTPRGPVEDFYRLFLVPGMGHCTANPGDYTFGNNPFRPVSREPDHDVLAALERWVEHGIAPDTLTAVGTATNDSAKVVTHPLCPYPRVAAFRGTGDSTDAANFVCALPADRR